MQLTSPAFEHEGRIPAKFTCDGPNVCPPLEISGVPAEARSLTIIMDDPDVPKHLRPDGMWDHWVVFNMAPTLKAIGEGQEPDGTQGIGTGGNLNYYGPCPPDREHRYFFKLYALDTMLDLNAKATKSQVEAAMQGHILKQCTLMGRYERG